MTKAVSSWSKQVGREVSVIMAESGVNAAWLADNVAVTKARMEKLLAGQSEWSIADLVSVALVFSYTPGGLLQRCLKKNGVH